MAKRIGDGSAIQRKYTPDDLRALWDFCQHDFDRFLELILWLEELPEKSQTEQVKAAHWLKRKKAGARP